MADHLSPADDAEEEATVLTSQPILHAEEFPQGLSPRELSLTLKGQLLGHFHLQEFIGGGGMGAVFKALDTTLDRIVAVKVVASQQISSEDLQRRFLIEAQSTARLDHPNIARIHYVGRDRGLPYIVFEYIDGVNLRDLVVHHGPIPVGDALSFTFQIAHALAHAWQKEVVHRDIKPSNILITSEGQAKLVDMGLARVHHLATAENELTNTGVTLGTFDYISPEQARDPREADTRSDIYSLGCTLFYMLAGRPPFADGTAVQKLLQHQDEEPPNLSTLRADIPESLSQLVLSMLAKSPDQRPQTPSEVVSTCHDIFRELGLQPPVTLAPLPSVPLIHTSSSWHTHLPWVLPLLGLLLVAFLLLVNNNATDQSIPFQPIRRPAEQTAPGVEATESTVQNDSETIPDSEASDSNEKSETTSPPAFEEQRNLNFDSPGQGESMLEELTVSPSLLEFPRTEQVPGDGSSIESSEELDLENLWESD